MFPLKDDVPSRRFPMVTLMIIIAFGALLCSVIRVNLFDHHYQKPAFAWGRPIPPEGRT
jgi:hypothetical protein